MAKLFERLIRVVGSFRTTKTTNRKTGRVTTKVSRVKNRGKIQKPSRGPRK